MSTSKPRMNRIEVERENFNDSARNTYSKMLKNIGNGTIQGIFTRYEVIIRFIRLRIIRGLLYSELNRIISACCSAVTVGPTGTYRIS